MGVSSGGVSPSSLITTFYTPSGAPPDGHEKRRANALQFCLFEEVLGFFGVPVNLLFLPLLVYFRPFEEGVELLFGDFTRAENPVPTDCHFVSTFQVVVVDTYNTNGY